MPVRHPCVCMQLALCVNYPPDPGHETKLDFIFSSYLPYLTTLIIEYV